jgi:hypothetical protein
MKATASRYEASVVAALEAVEIASSTSYRWMGETFDVPGQVARQAPPEALRGALTEGVKWRLYGSFFSTGGPTRARLRTKSGASRRALSQALSAANCGTGCLDPGWRLVGDEGECLVVARRGLRLWARPGEVVADGSGSLAPGDLVAVRLPCDVPELSPGFYMALGDRGFSAAAPRLLDRFYLNLRREGAVEFIRHATRRLNTAGLAFRAKVVDDPGGFDRCDSALLAFERCDRARAARAARRIHAELARFLDPTTPALTRRLAPGLAFAEDPKGEESFGTHRCQLIAEAVVAAHERGTVSLAGRLELVREYFAHAGTSLESPYLGPGSPKDPDGFPPVTTSSQEREPCP